MLWNYLITALRNHFKHPGYGLLSVFGLMLGLGAATLVFLYVWQETHFDRHLPDADRLHLVELEVSTPGRAPALVLAAPGPMAAAAKEVDGIEESSRLWLAWYTISIEDRMEFNSQLGAGDANLPAMLGLEMREGTREGLQDPSAVFVSVSMAEQLFGEGPYLGRRVTFGGNRDQEVAGVFADMPSASHLALNILLPLNAPPVTDRGATFDSNWRTPSVLTYLRLAPGRDAEAVGASLQSLLYQHVQAPEAMTLENYMRLTLEPVTALHLNEKSYQSRPKAEVGNPTQLWIAATIAVLILLVACINTVNIATARSADRAREVAMRKVVGASQKQLVVQFLGEAALLVALATLGALVFAEVVGGPVGEFIGRELSLSLLLQPLALLTFAAVLLAVTLLSGLYPAFVLARHRPHAIFQPVSGGGWSLWSLRTALVVFQFTASITLMILASVVWSQVRFMQSADLGFEASDVVLIQGIRRDPATTIRLSQRLDQALEGKPGIVTASAAHSSPSWDYADQARVRLVEASEREALTLDRLAVDLDFFELLGIEASAGRLFSETYAGDRLQWDLDARQGQELPVVLNQTAIASLGLANPMDAIGLALDFEVTSGQARAARVVGTVRDFHFKSLKSAIAPMIFFPDPSRFNLAMARLDPDRREQAMASLNEGWREAFPDQALSWTALDLDLVDQYVAEERQFTVLAVLASLAVLIAMLGLFGLLAHVIAGRRREISLRKVLGAELPDVLRLFLWQFSRPVFVALVIAWPLAWMLANRWLDSFAYRIDLSPLVFLGAGVAALAMTWLLTAAQVVRVSRTRPAEVLRAT